MLIGPLITRRGLGASALAVGITAFVRPTWSGPLPMEIAVGALIPLTGGAAVLGEQQQRGFTLFLDSYDQRRAREGLPKINVTWVDSQADSRIGFQGFQLLSSREHPALVILTMTNVAKAAAPLATKDRTAMLNMTQGPVTRLGPGFTSVVPAWTSQAAVALKAAKAAGSRTLGVLFDNQEASVDTERTIREELATKIGIELVDSERVPFGATEVSGQVTALLTHKPDAVFVVAAITSTLVSLAREIRTQGFTGSLYGTADMRDVLAAGEGKVIEGATYPNFWFDTEGGTARAFDSGYRTKYGAAPGQWALIAYKVGQILEATLHGLKLRNLDWNGENFVAVQKQMTVDTVSGEVSFLPDGRIIEPLVLTQVRNGVPVTLRVLKPEELRV